ncbi:MAG: flagellar motor protein MotB [Alkalilacustris sp.]
MDRQNKAAPIIIKRKKVVAAGHHGGAWKIAFADFATAMMAFFLVMWLINATDEETKQGLAAYFNPTLFRTDSSAGSDQLFGGNSVTSPEQLPDSARFDADLRAEGRDAADTAAGRASVAGRDEAEGTTDTLEELARQLRGLGGESVVADMALRHIVTRVTDEGLIVEVFDLPGQPLFVDDSDTPTEVLEVIARLLSEVFGLAGNGIAVEGHLRTLPVVRAENPAWALSTDRAQRMRLLLADEGVRPARFVRVTGHADRTPAARNPAAVRNNRLEIIMLRDGTSPDRVFSDP